MNEAIAKYRQLVEQYPNNELARFSLGQAYFQAGAWTEAREHFEFALARKPDWMVAHILIGKCDLATGHRFGAKAAFERARQLALDQNHEGPLEEMNQLLADLEQSAP